MTDTNGLILIVDDTPQNLQVLGQTLENNGFSIAVAMSGKEALHYVQETAPDLILLDVMMPEMDGYETCRQIKEIDEMKSIPVIFLTARSDTPDVLRGFETGAVDYVTKPFETTELLARVRTHVELKKARDEIKTLHGILPVCANCKAIRDEEGTWLSMEEYIEKHSEAKLTHGMCPTCVKKFYPDMADKIIGS